MFSIVPISVIFYISLNEHLFSSQGRLFQVKVSLHFVAQNLNAFHLEVNRTLKISHAVSNCLERVCSRCCSLSFRLVLSLFLITTVYSFITHCVPRIKIVEWQSGAQRAIMSWEILLSVFRPFPLQ